MIKPQKKDGLFHMQISHRYKNVVNIRCLKCGARGETASSVLNYLSRRKSLYAYIRGELDMKYKFELDEVEKEPQEQVFTVEYKKD